MLAPAWILSPDSPGLRQSAAWPALRAEALSAAIHILVVGVMLLPAFRNYSVPTPAPPGPPHASSPIFFPPNLWSVLGGRGDFGSNSGGGDRNPLPARKGDLPKTTYLPLAPPMPAVNPKPRLGVAMEIVGPPEIQLLSPPLDKIGLPWVSSATDSLGPGQRGGAGEGCCAGLGPGTQGSGIYGFGRNGMPLPPGGRPPACDYCPNPAYNDEARQSKLQGMVTLLVLVDQNGRASQVRIVKGLGLGLEQRAMEAVRGWRFRPAILPAGNAVPMWVTIEVSFRLL